ncbi:hypothetical protein lerEdw1_007326 [Lerista edwardsae]|nr:hypothetical protein lerEdw1_007326 [Lerista edwardsae]
MPETALRGARSVDRLLSGGTRKREALAKAHALLCLQLEFAVEMTCQSCVAAVQKALQDVPGLEVLHILLDSQSVLVETNLGTEKVQDLLESTGRKAVLKGMGGAGPQPVGSAAVAMVSGPGLVQGVVRFLQLSPQKCLVDGTIDGLEPGNHGLHIHEYGDVTDSCNSCGDHFNPDGECHGGPEDVHRHVGDLGNIFAAANGQAFFRMENDRLKVYDVIGRSLVVDSGEDDLGRGNHPLSKVTGNSGERVACGIIARSAGLFENPKKVCTCDGITLWEEKKQPRVAQRPTPHL